jgi:hypothetical protein
MFILNKKKHFQQMHLDFFNKSMQEIRFLREMLTSFGAGQYIEHDLQKFVGASFLYFLYLQSCALHTAYGQKYQNEVCEMLAAMSVEISKRCDYVPQKYTNLYLALREKLADDVFIEVAQKVGLYRALAISFLETAFSDEYNPEDAGKTNIEVEFSVGIILQEAMRYYTEYLKK